MKKRGVIAAAVLLAGCASVPTGPAVLVLPGSNKTTEQFQAADARCRQMASAALPATQGGNVSDQRRYDMAYIQCMYAAGNQVPVGMQPGYSTPYGWSPATTTTIEPPPTLPPGTPPPPAGTPPPPPPTR